MVPESAQYDSQTPKPLVESLLINDPDTGKKYFALPFTARDVTFNPNLASSAEAQHVDVRNTYSY